MSQLQEVQSADGVERLPQKGDRFTHFRQSTFYTCVGVATHGSIEADFCAMGIYEPTMERVRIVEMPDKSLVYQFPDFPNKDLGEMVLYQETDHGSPWCRCLPNFLETIVYQGKSVQRFTLIP